MFRQKSDSKSTNIIIKVENLERPKRRKSSKSSLSKKESEQAKSNRPSSSNNANSSSLKRKSPTKSSSPSFERHRSRRSLEAKLAQHQFQNNQTFLTLDAIMDNRSRKHSHHHHHHHHYHHHHHHSVDTELRNVIDKNFDLDRDEIQYSPTLSILSGTGNESIVQPKNTASIFTNLYNQGT